MLVFCNALTGADKTAEHIGFKAIIKYNKLDLFMLLPLCKSIMKQEGSRKGALYET